MTQSRKFLGSRSTLLGTTAAVCLVLAGCGGVSNITSGLGGGLFGNSKAPPPAAQPVTESQLLDAAKTNNSSPQLANTGSRGCPKFVIWQRDRNLTVYENGQEGDGLAIIRRGEITKTARECQVSPGRVTIRYGYSGRVLLGPRGTPGTFVLPVNVFVTDFNREKVQTQTHKVSVTVPTSQPIGYFSKVETVSFDVPQGLRPDDFKLFVGFEQPKSSG